MPGNLSVATHGFFEKTRWKGVVLEMHITWFVRDPISSIAPAPPPASWIWLSGVPTECDDQRKAARTMTMIAPLRMTSVAAGLMLAFWAPAIARADIPTAYALRPGTLLSTHTPPTATCPISFWHLLIGPGDTVKGTINVVGTNMSGI
jgi:hypothetical protein